jgi:hypothetical protein
MEPPFFCASGEGSLYVTAADSDMGARRCELRGQNRDAELKLPCCHITSNPIPTEVIRPAVRAEILPPKTPHLFGRLARTFPDSMRGLFATEKMPTTAHVGIDGFVDSREFGADYIEDYATSGHTYSDYKTGRSIPVRSRCRSLLAQSYTRQGIDLILIFQLRCNGRTSPRWPVP